MNCEIFKNHVPVHETNSLLSMGGPERTRRFGAASEPLSALRGQGKTGQPPPPLGPIVPKYYLQKK